MKINSKLSAARKFGIFFSIIFALLLVYSYVNFSNNSFFIKIFFITFLYFLFTTIFIPKTLIKPNELWMSVGFYIGKVANPIILGFLFFFIISPISIVTKIFGRDELKLKKVNLDTYWIKRKSIKFNLESFKNQY